MQRIFSFLTVICLTMTMALASFDAEARRFGGGASFGRIPSPTRSFTPNKAPKSTPGQRAGTPSWRGPLMGFIAGGLLASLFIGGGFSGINFFDIIILGLAIFLIVRFIRSRAAPQTSPSQNSNLSSFFGNNQTSSSTPVNVPAWFDSEAFLQAAKQHFMTLQTHWDNRDFNKIAEFVTPEMLIFLEKERLNSGDGYQSTYIDNLEVNLDDVEDNSYRTVVTITFTGVEKSSRFDQGQDFSESWRMERDHGQDKPWLIAGIRQNM